MLYKNYVGIDVSKLSIDAFIRESRIHRQFRNEESGFKQLIQSGLRSILEKLGNRCLFVLNIPDSIRCLSLFLEREHITYAMVPVLDIKRSLGITRGKNDQIDAKRIAEFAYRFNDRVMPTSLPAEDIRKLHSLLAMRDKMMRNMSGYITSRNELFRVIPDRELPVLPSVYENIISTLKNEVHELEREIRSIIMANKELKTTFELITTVKGIGFIVASFLIVYTCNFIRFENWRKFACYSGIAPFEYQSGTSIHARTQVSSIANQQMKRLLHLAAMTAIHFDAELHNYYVRSQAEGKSKMATINIVRNKLIARVFAIVKRGTPFVDIQKYVYL